MNDIHTTLAQLKLRHAQFTKDRDWNQFHTPKNLAMALAIEAAELMEHFQWVDTEGSWKVVADKREEVERELADVLCYVVAFANACDIDLSKAFEQKMQLNEQKYPVNQAKGKADKYTKYQE